MQFWRTNLQNPNRIAIWPSDARDRKCVGDASRGLKSDLDTGVRACVGLSVDSTALRSIHRPCPTCSNNKWAKGAQPRHFRDIFWPHESQNRPPKNQINFLGPERGQQLRERWHRSSSINSRSRRQNCREAKGWSCRGGQIHPRGYDHGCHGGYHA